MHVWANSLHLFKVGLVTEVCSEPNLAITEFAATCYIHKSFDKKKDKQFSKNQQKILLLSKNTLDNARHEAS
jgi:hypothetical protein